MDLRQHSQVISGGLSVGGKQDFRLRWDPRGQLEWFAFGGAGSTAVQGRGGSIGDRDQVVDAEGLAASVTVELIAAGAEHGAASGAGVDFQDHVPGVFVVFDRKAFEERIAGGAGGRVESLSHKNIMP